MKKILSILMAFILSVGLVVPVVAADKSAINAALTDTAEYVYKTVKNPQVGSEGGEWAVLGLARSGYSVPDSYYAAYYKTVEAYVKACNGVLHDKKYTEYSRVILGLTAAGYDPRNVGGYDLTMPLGDFDSTVWQGINGSIFALIALDSGDYEIPVNKSAKTQATREMYIDEILSRQLQDGGFALSGNQADPDVTGMVLQALAKYQDNITVKNATAKALDCLSNMQDSNGGYSSWGERNSESTVQVLVALCELGISPDDPRFVKNGNSTVDNLLSYYKKGAGIAHTADGSGSSQMATEQGLYGLAAVKLFLDGESSLYRMSGTKTEVSADFDVSDETDETDENTITGLSSKHADVKILSVVTPGKTFDDIKSHVSKTAIEALASYGIIAGKTDIRFDPDATMTRAEFATIVVRALGLPAKNTAQFTDVKSNDWFASYVGTAYYYEIVSGTSATTFNPNGIITRQEAAVMVARAAKLAGMDTGLDEAEIRNMLAQFGDYITAADWAKSSLAFCYKHNILSQEMFDIKPAEAVTRGEIAEMIFRVLGAAELI